MTHHSRMTGFGRYVPPKIVSNADFAAQSGITDEWIVSRTGISTRHILEPGMTGADMAFRASARALERAGRSAGDITHILYATCTPDAASPPSACALAEKLGIKGRMAVDLNAACSGFLNGMELADGLVKRDPAACVLLVASESLSHRCNREDHGTAVLFGDGAGAVIITGENPSPPANKASVPSCSIDDISLGSDGGKAGLLLITGGYSATPYALGDCVGPEYFIRMNGGLVYKHAVRNMSACCLELMERNGISSEDIDLFIPHQANLRIIEAVGSRLGIDAERVFLNVQQYGNTSAASIPLAMSEAVDAGRIGKNMRVLITTFGGGLTWGAGLMRVTEDCA